MNEDHLSVEVVVSMKGLWYWMGDGTFGNSVSVNEASQLSMSHDGSEDRILSLVSSFSC